MLNATTQKIFSVEFLIMDLSDQVDAAVLRLDYARDSFLSLVQTFIFYGVVYYYYYLLFDLILSFSNLSNLLIPLIITQPLFYPLIIPPETSTAHIDRNQCMTSACLQKKKKKPLKRMKAKQIKPKYDSKCFIRVNK